MTVHGVPLACLLALTILAASVQATVGFGQSLVLAPGLLAAGKPGVAIMTALLLSLLANTLVLTESGRRRCVDWAQVSRLALAALPGMGAGLVVLAAVPRPALQVAVGVLVLAALALRRYRPSRPRGRSLRADAFAGLACGLLNTTTSLSGPPLVLRLAGAAPGAMRDTLTATLLVTNIASAVILVAAGPDEPASGALLGLVLAPAVLVGHALGRRAFERASPAQFARTATALIALAGAASVAGGLLA